MMRSSGRGIVLPLAFIIGVTAVVGGTMYVTSATDVFGDEDSSESSIDKIPSGVQLVASVDINSLMEEERVNELIETGQGKLSKYDSDYDIPEDYQSIVKRIKEKIGLSLEELESVTLFGKFPKDSDEFLAGGYGAALVQSQWEEEEIVDALENITVNLTKKTYKEFTVYKLSCEDCLSSDLEIDRNPTLAILSDGFYAIGSVEAVHDVIDTVKGDRESFDGDLRSDFEQLGDGQIRLAIEIPSREISEMESIEGIGLKGLAKVELSAGVLSIDGSDISIKARLRTSDTDSAKEIHDSLNGVMGLAKAMIGSQDFKEELGKVSIDRDGVVVIVDYETSIEEFSSMIQDLQSFSKPSISIEP